MSCFVHCNQCFCRPNKDLQLFITNCGHMFCERCASKDPIAKGMCAVCKKSIITQTLLGKMKPDTQEYFTDISHFLKKMEKINTFQKFHFQRYVSHLEIEAKKLKAENIRYERKLVEMEQFMKKGGTGQFRSQSQQFQNVAQPQMMAPKMMAPQMMAPQMMAPQMSCSQMTGPQMMQRSQNLPRSYEQLSSKLGSTTQRYPSSQPQRGQEMINRFDNASLKSTEYYTPRSAGSSIIYHGLIGSKPTASRISLGPRSNSGHNYGTFRKSNESPSSGGKEASMDYMSSYSCRTPQMMGDIYVKKRATVSPYGR